MTAHVPIPRPALVAVCDVLGFNRLLGLLGVQRLAGELWQLVLAQREGENAQRMRLRRLDDGQVEVARQEDEVFSAVFSDTFLIWTFDIGGWSARHLFGQLNRILFEGLTRRLPIRGAVALGDAVIENQDCGLFAVGDPIAWAAGLEKEQEWSGIAIHPSCTGLDAWPELVQHNLVCRYPVPLKSPQVSVFWAVNWMKNVRRSELDKAEDLWGNWPPGCADEKRSNTVAFARRQRRVSDRVYWRPGEEEELRPKLGDEPEVP